MPPRNRETILTSGPGGRILTNANVWSADGEWIVFDTRSDPAGDRFNGTKIQAVHVESGEIRTLYESRNGAHCGVATCHPSEPKVVCIVGPEHPTADWSYGPTRRQGIVIGFDGGVQNLDARDLVPPFTPGALRGGSHVHTWHPRGDWVSFTYDDELLKLTGHQRNIGVALPGRTVRAPKTNPRNHDGEHFSVVVTRTTAEPRIGSDGISTAYEEAWIGSTRSIAFQGLVHTPHGSVAEVFAVDLPDELHHPGDGPLEGTESQRPAPPRGVVQRRLTRTLDHKYPGLRGAPRHWLRSSPDGSKIGFLKRGPRGVVQFWTVNPAGGEPQQVTDSPRPMASAFTWHPDGLRVACVIGGSVCVIDTVSGTVARLTGRGDDTPRPEACVFSPDGSRIAFVRTLGGFNQICVVEV